MSRGVQTPRLMDGLSLLNFLHADGFESWFVARCSSLAKRFEAGFQATSAERRTTDHGPRTDEAYSAPTPRYVLIFSSSNMASASGSRVAREATRPRGMRGHRDDRRIAQRKDRRRVVEEIDPDRRAEHDEQHRQRGAAVTIELTAPAVVKRFQTIDSSSGGKFALQAIANARPTMNATFCPLKTMPRRTASAPNTTVASAATRTCSWSLARARGG